MNKFENKVLSSEQEVPKTETGLGQEFLEDDTQAQKKQAELQQAITKDGEIVDFKTAELRKGIKQEQVGSQSAEKEAAKLRRQEYVRAGFQAIIDDLEKKSQSKSLMSGLARLFGAKPEVAVQGLKDMQAKNSDSVAWGTILNGALVDHMSSVKVEELDALADKYLKPGELEEMKGRVAGAARTVKQGLSEVTQG